MKGVSLIERYGLSSRIPSRKGKEVDTGETADAAEQMAGAGRGQWSESREEREKGLRERKERMILQARK
jgi:coupling of ubiquitin conjugation to ER degradation protein 1